MRLCRADVARVDLEPLRPLAGEWFFCNKEHYKLLAHLSTRVQSGPIFDLSMRSGDSALALSYGGAPVETFDVTDPVQERPQPLNVHRHRGDLLTPEGREAWKEKLLESRLVFVDADPHEGTREYEFVRWLQEHNYQGIIALDDIWYFKPMRDNCWYQIEGKYRTDATMLGHWSGTGLVSFGERVEVEGETDTSDWTLVTGYFDLTKKADASAELCTRPATYFIDDHGMGTLGLDQNLIVHCEPELESKIWALRPKYLHPRTRVVAQSFEDFPLTKYRAQVIANRGGSPWCPTHPRSTASYYLFCMARYAMLKETIADNPFGSTHFAWINIDIERMGYQNLIHLDEALGVHRDKFSTCFIDYAPKILVQNLDAFFGGRACLGRCTMCSGFFTGNAEYMGKFCDRIEAEFVRCLDAGYGHSDEQLFPMAYFANPELFEWYLGDYAEMVTNYAHVYDRVEQPIRNLIRNSLAANDREVCARACDIVWRSLEAGTCSLTSNQGQGVSDHRAPLTDADLGSFLRARLICGPAGIVRGREKNG